MSATLPFDVFHRLIRQALGEAPSDETLDLQVFGAPDVPGAAVLKFFPEELAESLHAVYVPAGLDDDGTVVERLHAAVATHAGLQAVETLEAQRAILREVRSLLERYLAATDGGAGPEEVADADDGGEVGRDAARDTRSAGDAEEADDAAGAAGVAPARIEFGPLEALQALAAAHSGGGPGPAAGEFPESGAAGQSVASADHEVAAGAAPPVAAAGEETDELDERVTFRALALDILSGVPHPHGSSPSLPDSYEVWAYRHDRIATVVLRLFDEGRAAVLGALAPDDESFDTGRFFGAAYRLLTTRMPGAVDGGLDGRLSDLESLPVAQAMERLGRALGAEHEQEVRELTTNLLGEASAETEAVYEDIRLLDPEAEESAASRFAGIAADLVAVGGDALWTHRRERARAPRIEVLEHSEFAGALLLIDFGEAEDPVEVAAYVPGAPDEAANFRLAARALLDARDVFGTPVPLAAGGPFRRVPNSRAANAVESARAALQAGEGRAVAFRDPRTH